MKSTGAWSICPLLCVLWLSIEPVAADEAASSYLFATLELDGPVPTYVDSATTDDPDLGFATELSDVQMSYLKQPAIGAALDRFDHATSFSECDWSRYSRTSWSSARLDDRLHHLARIALLRARLHYEAGRWIEGNRDVERVRVMARHMALQARPFEHQCFMIENMATGTAAAYILRLPQPALADLLERHNRLKVFSPKAAMYASEAERIRTLANDCDDGEVAVGKLLEFVDPYLVDNEFAQRVRTNSREDTVVELLGLADFLRAHSQLMELEHGNAEHQIASTYRRQSENCRLVADFAEPWFGDYRENSQGICRGFMFGSAVQQLQNGQENFATIKDPYGSGSLTFQSNEVGFTLTSELRHHSQIDLRFGLAGRETANPPMQPSGEIGRPEVDDQPSPLADR